MASDYGYSIHTSVSFHEFVMSLSFSLPALY